MRLGWMVEFVGLAGYDISRFTSVDVDVRSRLQGLVDKEKDESKV